MNRSSSDFATPAATKVHLHPSGAIDITPALGSPVHIVRTPPPDDLQLNELTKDPIESAEEELQQLKQKLQQLTSQAEKLPPPPPTISSPSVLHPSGFTASSHSLPSVDATGSSGKAVLSALRALQEKIRRLESEKQDLMQQNAILKTDARKKEALYQTNAKKSEYELRQKNETARNAYEAIRSEKENLQLQFVQRDEQCKTLEKELIHFKTLLEASKQTVRDLTTRISESEKQNSDLKMELTRANATNETRMNDICESIQRQEQTVEHYKKVNQSLEEELHAKQQLNQQYYEQVQQTEKALTSIVQVNERLMGKLAKQKSKKAAIKAAETQVKREWRKTSVMRSTAASRAAEIPATKKKLRPKTKSKAKKSGKTPLEKLKAANMGEIPFLLGKSTKPSFSVIGSLQETLAQADFSAATASDRQKLMPEVFQQRKTLPPPQNVQVHVPQMRQDLQGVVEEAPTRMKMREESHVPIQEKVKPQEKDNTLAMAVESIEEEYDKLNHRYLELVEQLKAQQAHEEAKVTAPGKKTKEMQQVLEQMNEKGKQLYYIKNAQHELALTKDKIQDTLKFPEFPGKAPYERQVVHSPQAVERKTAAFQILRKYREMSR